MLGLYVNHNTSHAGHVSSTVMTINADVSSRPKYKALDHAIGSSLCMIFFPNVSTLVANTYFAI